MLYNFRVKETMVLEKNLTGWPSVMWPGPFEYNFILHSHIGYVFGLARRGSTIGFHLLWHTVELALSTRLCLL